MMPKSPLKVLSFIALASVMTSVLLMAVRSYYAISFIEPLQGATRGAEYENLYSIWKYIFGGAVYADQTKIPFAGSYYNWLFYAAYGEVAELFLRAFSLNEAWLPTIIRLTTGAGLFVGAFLAYRSFTDLLEIDDPALKILSASFAVFVFFGPLIGFFGISATPDIWPLVIAVASTWYFIRNYHDRPLLTILLICALSYIAWGFKQNFIYIPAIIGAYLLLRRRWRDAAILTAVLCISGVVTMIIGGSIFSKMLYFGGTHIYLSLDQFFISFMNFAVKTIPLSAAAAAVIIVIIVSSEARLTVVTHLKNRPTMTVPFLGVLITGIEAFPTSAIIYAGEHHFFTFSYYLAFSTLTIIVRLAKKGTVPKFFILMLSLGWFGNILASGSVLLGFKGVLSVRSHHEHLTAVRACLKDVPRPVYVEDPNSALPWMLPATQHFVVHMNYFSDRAAGIEKESGGIGGLIDKGFFATLALGEGRAGGFDGSDLKLYKKRSEPCGGFDIYARIEKAN